MTVAQANAAADSLHDQLTLVRTRDHPRDTDRNLLSRRKDQELRESLFLDRELASAMNDPDVRAADRVFPGGSFVFRH